MLDSEIENIANIHKRYSETQIEHNVIIFYNCSLELLEFFRKSYFLTSYIITDNMVIILKYDLITFPKIDYFYNYIINSVSHSLINSFSYYFSDSVDELETFHIVHNNTFAELIIYYDDLALDMGIDSIEFNIDGMYTALTNFPLDSIGDTHIKTIFKFITDFIDDRDLNMAFDVVMQF